MNVLIVCMGCAGDSLTIDVDCFDENGRHYTFPIDIDVQKQDKPRLVGVRVMGKPVLLRSAEIVFNAGSPLDPDQPRIVAAACKKFRTFGGGVVGDPLNPISHWTKNEPLMFAMGVSVADVVRFVVEQINGARA